MKKVYKPLWSLDVEKTERWLSSMSASGFNLVRIDLLSRCFVFKEGVPQQRTYRIGYERQRAALPPALADSGWVTVFSQRSWYVIMNEVQSTKIIHYPVRTGIINRNNWLTALCFILLAYGLVTLITHLFITGWTLFKNVPITIVESPLWVLTPFIILALTGFWILVIYSCYTLIQSNKRLGGSTGMLETEKVMKEDGDRMRRWRFGWWYAPDRLEKWLEGMEKQGYHLDYVGKQATSYWFMKEKPRKVKYSVDYQRSVDQGYYEVHQENGWRLLHTQKNYPGYWSIWCQEYKQDSPQLYSEKADVLKHAKRVVAINLLLLVPLFLLMLLMLNGIGYQLEQGLGTRTLFSNIIFAALVFENGLFSYWTVGYYLRIRRTIRHD